MSVKKNQARGKWEVRWLEGGRHRSRLFDRKGDADAFDLDKKRQKQLGTLAPQIIQTKTTLAEFVLEEYWPNYALPNLAASTRQNYLDVWETHLEPRLGGYELLALTPEVVEDFVQQLEGKKVGRPRQQTALTLLSGILRRAEVRGRIPRGSNPVKVIDKPRVKRKPQLRPLSPHTVETIRAVMLEPKTRRVPTSEAGKRARRGYEAPYGSELERVRNALIVSMLAYGGPRPIEERAATWEHLNRAVWHIFATKTSRDRYVNVLDPLRQDIDDYRLLYSNEVGVAQASDLIIARADGTAWTKLDWANWRNRVYKPAAIAAGVTGDLRPYRLRGSFVSLLLWEGRSIAYVADQVGNSVAVLARHYTGVMRELEGEKRVPAAEAIKQARDRVAAGQRTGHEPAPWRVFAI
jgi:site-specific recombinase XerD